MDSIIEPVRQLVKRFMARLAKDLDNLSGSRISPNMITIIGLVAHIPIAWLIATGQFTLAAVLLIIFGLFDTLDGALARQQKTESKRGMFLDSVTDRVKEVMLYIGIAYSFVNNEQSTYAVWALAACGAAVTTSYINAWGEVTTSGMKTKNHQTNRSFRTGFMTFDIRMAFIILGLLSGKIELFIVVIAVLSWITVIQRITNVMKKFDV